jgi:Family of unknown function (DUF6879)
VNTDDFGRLFESFSHSAFRVETLPEYKVEVEAHYFRLFLLGHPPPESRKERAWLKTVAAANARGGTMQRVRVVRRPLTHYIAFELEWGFPENEQAGEQIRILELAHGEHLPDVDHDFWLFDDSIVVRMEYDDEGRFVRPVAEQDATTYRRCRDAVMARSVPLKEWKGAQEIRSG